MITRPDQFNSPIAQLVERRTVNADVRGSCPRRGAIPSTSVFRPRSSVEERRLDKAEVLGSFPSVATSELPAFAKAKFPTARTRLTTRVLWIFVQISGLAAHQRLRSRPMPKRDEPEELLTAQEVLREFRQNGVTISDWAKERGFNPRVVYAVLSGTRKALRGESHRAAVALGMQRDTTEPGRSAPRKNVRRES